MLANINYIYDIMISFLASRTIIFSYFSGRERDNNSNNNSNSDSPPNGRALVSQRVSVLWDDDGKWYSGIITDFRNAHGKREHQIVYDVDGGAVMRSVPQAQGLLANGTTTHEWLVFEPEANSSFSTLSSPSCSTLFN